MEIAVIFDLQDPSGPAQIMTHALRAAEMIERGQGRYVRVLPPNVRLGPKRGLDRIVL
jgi:hypothetical protein